MHTPVGANTPETTSSPAAAVIETQAEWTRRVGSQAFTATDAAADAAKQKHAVRDRDAKVIVGVVDTYDTRLSHSRPAPRQKSGERSHSFMTL